MPVWSVDTNCNLIWWIEFSSHWSSIDWIELYRNVCCGFIVTHHPPPSPCDFCPYSGYRYLYQRCLRLHCIVCCSGLFLWKPICMNDLYDRRVWPTLVRLLLLVFKFHTRKHSPTTIFRPGSVYSHEVLDNCWLDKILCEVFPFINTSR